MTVHDKVLMIIYKLISNNIGIAHNLDTNGNFDDSVFYYGKGSFFKFVKEEIEDEGVIFNDFNEAVNHVKNFIVNIYMIDFNMEAPQYVPFQIDCLNELLSKIESELDNP